MNCSICGNFTNGTRLCDACRKSVQERDDTQNPWGFQRLYPKSPKPVTDQPEKKEKA